MTRTANAALLPQRTPHVAASTSGVLETVSLQRCKHALDMMLTQRGDAFAEVGRLLAGDPGCIFAHCLRLAFIVRGESVARKSTLAESIAAIEATSPNVSDLAHRHAVAAQAWLNGDSAGAVELYGAILTDRPHDVLALAVTQALDFHLGQRRTMRDRIAKVLPHWTADMFGYASVLAMYAFALEENGQYHHAEKVARRVLALDSGHPGGIHVVAHVMEMQGRVDEGLAFLVATEPAWRSGTGLSAHLAWHRALFHLDTNKPKSALAIYDAQIATVDSSDISALADSSALLWRLQLQDIDVSQRWRQLADRWAMHNLANARSFYVVHAMMAFAAAGRTDAVARLAQSLPDSHMNEALSLIPEDALVSPLCEALYAFACRDFVACVESLKRVRHIANRCGGSLAQCDLIHLTFTEAALRAREARLARALIAERVIRKPTSRLNRLFQRRLGTRQAHQPRRGGAVAAIAA